MVARFKDRAPRRKRTMVFRVSLASRTNLEFKKLQVQSAIRRHESGRAFVRCFTAYNKLSDHPGTHCLYGKRTNFVIINER